ncbi:hypothetical protein ACVFYP_27065 [Roseomonas sp. F4]
MRIVTFGSCLARFTGAALAKRFGTPLLGSVYHNRIDRFVPTYVTGETKELDPAVLRELVLLPDQIRAFQELIGNQYRHQRLGMHALPRGRPGFMAAVESGDVDLVLLDNFMDLRARMLRPRRHPGSSLFFLYTMAENTARLFAGQPLLDARDCAGHWAEMVAWLRRKLPRARIVFMPFPGSQYEQRPEIGLRSVALADAFDSADCIRLPLLDIPPERLLPNDRTHFVPAQYDAYGRMALGESD